ncbi:helix-hairpin-helix domain-containing protein [Brevibacillus borstelensis]|uniref:helix-hairpin-helix domain-containing protein n=1 Tax=Brevibacillus TaxID=55080 RepID=UPI00287FB9B4|nr:helix-hairpin-helix domain-containing protein [Brevibacillus borstelensis]MED1874085.1 helix-hairpin-helix domain-containing protein [Brevibacillus borstelensis]WNF04086.1 helix-hairpin-helix domain-containing protein [Brevibacillus borstelensis]
MLYDLWERYRRYILISLAVVFAGVSFWIYRAQQNTVHAGSPFQEVASANESDITLASSESLLPAAVSNPQQQGGVVSEMGVHRAGSPYTALSGAGASSEGVSLGGTSSGSVSSGGASSGSASSGSAPSASASSASASSNGSGRTGASPPLLYVDVKGKVKHPGLYALEPGARVADAIEKAGGTLPDGDVERINLAEKLTDGSAILIPVKGAASACSQQDVASAVSPSASASASGSSSGSASPSAAGKGVNVNTATLEELMTLPGVGESRAKAILEYRTKKGGFRSPDELKQISGIGAKIYERMKDQIRIQ